MIFHKKKNKNNISIELGESYITYTIKDETTNRMEKVPYENILNDKYEFYESNKAFKNNAIYTGIIGSLFLAINIFYGSKLWAWIFILACPTFFYLYHRSKAAFTVIKTAGDITSICSSCKTNSMTRWLSASTRAETAIFRTGT